MNEEILRLYGLRLGKILAHLCILLCLFSLLGLLFTVAVPLVIVFRILAGIILVICSLGLLLLREDFREIMFSADSLEATAPFMEAYLSVLPALIAVTLVSAAASFALMLCCGRKGERPVLRMILVCLAALIALLVAALVFLVEMG